MCVMSVVNSPHLVSSAIDAEVVCLLIIIVIIISKFSLSICLTSLFSLNYFTLGKISQNGTVVDEVSTGLDTIWLCDASALFISTMPLPHYAQNPLV